MYSRQGKIQISNLPNTTSHQHIIQYLSTVGSIKQYYFDGSGQRLSATVIYHDYESAETAKKFLDQKQFNTRKIKITLDQNRQLRIDNNNLFKTRLISMKKEDKVRLYRYLKALRDQEGPMFVDFLDANPDLVQQLLR